MNNTTRERWLQRAVKTLRPFVLSTGQLTLPDNIHMSVGFPSTRALSRKRPRIGECWRAEASADGFPHVFVTPLMSDGVDVLSCLIHELIHASGVYDHKAGFHRPAMALGLTGKMTSTVAGPELTERLNAVVAKLGPYPHSLLSAAVRPVKKQTTRLLKAECECGAIIRLSAKVVDDPGLPTCACGGDFELDV